MAFWKVQCQEERETVLKIERVWDFASATIPSGVGTGPLKVVMEDLDINFDLL